MREIAITRGRQVARAVAAVLAAALAPALSIGGLPMLGGAPPLQAGLGVAWVFAFALLHALLIGLPVYLLLRRRGPVSLYVALLGGVLTTAPLMLWLAIAGGGANSTSWSGDTMTMIEGRWTIAGWISLGLIGAFFGLLGALGGGVFWGVLTITRSASSPARAALRAYGAAALAIAATTVVLAAAQLARAGVLR